MATFQSILVADDEASIRQILTVVLSQRGYEVRAVSNGEEALKELAARPYDAVICDVRMPKVDGLSVLKEAIGRWGDLTFIMISAYGSPETALEAVAAGAYDYVAKPFKPEEVLLVVKKAEERRRLLEENRRLKDVRGSHHQALDQLLGQSEAIQKVHQQIRKLGPVASTVLITGESGTGKELVARAIHQLSSRAAMPFVPVNCGAIPAGLIESELFGHAKGAFTDAKGAKTGLLDEADGGSVLLDEVAELPPPAQVKLLRFLQEGEVRPVGETRAKRVDVRVIAATHKDLSQAVSAGQFREDLFYRLNVVNLHLPPLRERTDDIVPLANGFLLRFRRDLNRPDLEGLSDEAADVLRAYRWPGNVRELENAIERAVVLSEPGKIRIEALPEKVVSSVGPAWGAGARPLLPEGLVPPDGSSLSLKRATRTLEEAFIAEALRRTNGNRTKAAELLGISHRGLLYKLKEYRTVGQSK